MSTPTRKTPLHASRELSAANLQKAILRSDNPEQLVRTFPAQSLFMSIKDQGLLSSSELISIASIEQCRLLLDFDLWRQDDFNETNLWEWLELADEDSGLEILQKILKCIDLKLIALLIARHVDVQTFEEKTEQPPAPGYYTPDSGSTWIGITIEDGTKHFLMGRLLAMLFETSAELFYQLLSVAATQTASVLEEESYQDRTRRLSNEGVPDSELSAMLHAPASDAEVRAVLSEGRPKEGKIDIRAIEPLVYSNYALEPLQSALAPLLADEEIQGEITLLMNAALVRFGADFGSAENIALRIAQVKGALNIGLERAIAISGDSPTATYRAVGGKLLYRLGMSHLFALRKRAMKLTVAENDDVLKKLAVQALSELPPRIPAAIAERQSPSAASDPVRTDFRELSSVRDIAEVSELLGLSHSS